MRRFGIFGFSTAVLGFACAVGAMGCEGGDELSIPGGAGVSSGPEARAIEHVRVDPSRALADVDHDFEVRSVVVDPDGREHVHLDRRYMGLRVLGGDIIVHGRASGDFEGVTHTLASRIQIDFAQNIGEEAAIAVALAEQKNALTDEPPEAELIVYARGPHPTLAYDVTVFGTQADDTPSELHVIVGAALGDVLEAWDGVETAAANGTGKTYFGGTIGLTTNSGGGSFEMKDPSRGNQYTIDMKQRKSGGSLFTDADNTWGDSTLANRQTVGADAQYGTAVTWDYYLNVHGRSGIANDGKGAYNRVHYGRSYNNAFWSNSCFCMTYGDGDGLTFNPFTSLDVAGHEMTHGVTSRTAGLVYSGESGGLNEATSDIFGSMVEFYANNPNDNGDYRIGEKLYKSGGWALRYMYNPDNDGHSKGCWYSGIGSLDVHYSSGVANHFYYLLAEGSSSPLTNTCNTGLSLSGIGRDDAAAIWYRALTVYMTSSTNYAGARTATLNAASDLFGANSAQRSAVATAWSAVNVN